MPSWPTPQDYNEAIQNPKLCFHDADLKQGTIECNALGLPKSASGAFASVFKLTTSDGPWAIRCFLRFRPEQSERYQKISQFVLFDDLDCTVDFHFIEKGILVRGDWYPIVKMKWIYGDTLDLYIHKHFDNAEKMSKLSADFFDLVMQLENADIAHGDLQHGNIIVSDDGLRLVDYDALFVPALAGLEALEFGHPNYQHPMRSPNHFDPTVDNFSTWLIHASLMAIRIDPGLFKTFMGGDESILFKRKDLLSPETSPLFKALFEHDSDEIRNTAQILTRMLWANPCAIPPLHATAYDLSALPNVQTISIENEVPHNSTSELRIAQGDAELSSVIRMTVDRCDATTGKFQHKRKKFRFKATAVGLSKRAQANVIKLIDASVRKSVPASWTSIKLREGDRHYDLGQYEKAIEAFLKIQTHRDEFLKQNVNELVELQLRLGRAFGMSNNFNSACNYFLMAAKTSEQANLVLQHQRARFLLALARHQSGKEEDAYTLINALNSQISLNLDDLIKKENRFGYLRNERTLRLIEKYARSYTDKGDLKRSVEILEIGRELAANSKAPASPAFRESYLDLLIRLGSNYVRLGFYSYAHGISVEMDRINSRFEPNSFYKLRVQLYAAIVFMKMSSSAKLHPLLSRLAATLRAESNETIESAVKSMYGEFGEKDTLAVLATSASYLNDHHVKKRAVEIAKLAWQLVMRDWNGSLLDKIRWLKNLEPSLLLHCLDEKTTQDIVAHVEKNIRSTKAINETEITLAALHSIGKPAQAATFAVMDEMIRMIRKYDYLFGTRQIAQAKSILKQYDFSNTRNTKLDDIDGGTIAPNDVDHLQ